MKTQSQQNGSFNVKNLDEILNRKKLITQKTVTERTVIAGSSQKKSSNYNLNPAPMPNECTSPFFDPDPESIKIIETEREAIFTGIATPLEVENFSKLDQTFLSFQEP